MRWGVLPISQNSGLRPKDLPQDKCRSRGTIAPGRHGRQMPTIPRISTASHGWSACADQDVVQQMRPRQRLGYFAAGLNPAQNVDETPDGG
jgi:hypothetical protein